MFRIILSCVVLLFATEAFAEKPPWAGKKDRAEREQLKEEWHENRERYRDEDSDSKSDDRSDEDSDSKSDDRSDEDSDSKSDDRSDEDNDSKSDDRSNDQTSSSERILNEVQQRRQDGIAPGNNTKKWWEFWRSND